MHDAHHFARPFGDRIISNLGIEQIKDDHRTVRPFASYVALQGHLVRVQVMDTAERIVESMTGADNH